jgi:hypothetical protein
MRWDEKLAFEYEGLSLEEMYTACWTNNTESLSFEACG